MWNWFCRPVLFSRVPSTMMRKTPILLLLAIATLAAVPPSVHAAERWVLQFFHDEDDSTFEVRDLSFVSPRVGIAIGELNDNGRSRPAALLTQDGGENWDLVRLKESGRSLFLLNETLGWIVTRKDIRRTSDSGRTWKKLDSPSDLLRVHFRDEKRGWAVGLEKVVYETQDGGEHWTKVPASVEPKTDPSPRWYGWIAFADDKVGMIAGSSKSPGDRDSLVPDWMDPEEALQRKSWPAVTILLLTSDGGESWTPSVPSLFGALSRIRLSPDGRGLGLVESSDSSVSPLVLHQIDVRTGKSRRVFRPNDTAVTDMALPANGPAYLATVEKPGRLLASPVPGKLHLLQSENLTDWQEMEVDYRAVANRAFLAAVDSTHIWVATDTGMILKLVVD